jgi:hypothetical protein
VPCGAGWKNRGQGGQESDDGSGCHGGFEVIDSFAPIDPKTLDVVLPEHDGYPDDIAAGDTRDVLRDACGSASREFPSALWIEPRDWAEAARQNDKYQTWPINWMDRFTNQSPTDECTCHSLRACVEAARNKQRSIIVGPPKAGERLPVSSKSASVWLSPLSVYAEANPRKSGGAGVRQVLEIATRRGMLPETIQPSEYGFRHAIVGTTGRGGINQASGDWVSVSRFPDGWQETAKHFRPLEVVFPETWEQAVCLVLHGYAVSVGRSGHCIPYSVWNATEQRMGYVDSYDVERWDSLGTVRGCAASGSFAILSTTVPDDWSKPA